MKYLVFVPGLEKPVSINAVKYDINTANIIEFKVFDEKAFTPGSQKDLFKTIAIFNLCTIAGFMEGNT